MIIRIKLICIFIPILTFGCDHKNSPAENEGNMRTAIDQRHPNAGNSARATASVRDKAKLELLRNDLISPGVFEESIEHLRTLAGKMADDEGISYPEALNELYLTLGNGQPPVMASSLRGLFGETMLKDPAGIESIMSELPAGDLRRVGVACIRGEALPIKTIKEVYSLMPESEDRSEIANELVTRSFLDEGVDSALTVIKTISSHHERDRALNALASCMSTSESFGGRSVNDKDVDKIKSYAKSIGQERQVKSLDLLVKP